LERAFSRIAAPAAALTTFLGVTNDCRGLHTSAPTDSNILFEVAALDQFPPRAGVGAEIGIAAYQHSLGGPDARTTALASADVTAATAADGLTAHPSRSRNRRPGTGRTAPQPNLQEVLGRAPSLASGRWRPGTQAPTSRHLRFNLTA